MKLVLLLVVALALAQDPAKPPPSAKPNQLTFAWPNGVTARVETERTREQRVGTDAPAAKVVRARYQMTVLPHQRGRLIRYSDYELLEPKTSPAEADALSQMVTAFVPSIVVSPNGRFVAVEDITALKAVVDALFASVNSEVAQARGLKELLGAVTSEPFLASLSEQDWSALVATWVDLPLELTKRSVETEEFSPAFPGIAMPLKTTIGMVSRSPCRRSAATVECVTVELTSIPERAAMDKIIARLMDGVKGMDTISYDKYDVQTTIRVTMEAETMLPHQFELTKTVDMSISIGKEAPRRATQVERRTAKYEYR